MLEKTKKKRNILHRRNVRRKKVLLKKNPHGSKKEGTITQREKWHKESKKEMERRTEVEGGWWGY